MSIIQDIKNKIVVNKTTKNGKFSNSTINPSGFTGVDLETEGDHKYLHVYHLLAMGQGTLGIGSGPNNATAQDEVVAGADVNNPEDYNSLSYGLTQHHGNGWVWVSDDTVSDISFDSTMSQSDFITLMSWYKTQVIDLTDNVSEPQYETGTEDISGFRYVGLNPDDPDGDKIVFAQDTNYQEYYPEARVWFTDWAHAQDWVNNKFVQIPANMIDAVEIYMAYIRSNSPKCFGNLSPEQRQNVTFNILYTTKELFRINPLLSDDIFSYDNFKLTISVYLRLILYGTGEDKGNLERLRWYVNSDFVYFWPSQVNNLSNTDQVPVDYIDTEGRDIFTLNLVSELINFHDEDRYKKEDDDGFLEPYKYYSYSRQQGGQYIYDAPMKNYKNEFDTETVSNYANNDSKNRIFTVDNKLQNLSDIYNAMNFLDRNSSHAVGSGTSANVDNLFGGDDNAYELLKEAFGNPIDPTELRVLTGPRGKITYNPTDDIESAYLTEFANSATLAFNSKNDLGEVISEDEKFFVDDEIVGSISSVTFKNFFDRAAFNAAQGIFQFLIFQLISQTRQEYFDLLYDYVVNPDIDIDEAKEKILTEIKNDISQEVEKAEAAAATIDTEEIKAKQIVMGQCAMLANLEEMQKDYKTRTQNAKLSGARIHGKGFYNNRFYNLVSNNPTSTLNTIFNKTYSEIERFLSISPQIQAYLVPYIKIEKVFVNAKNILETVEIPFSNYSRDPLTTASLDLTEKLRTPGLVFKGGGSGIKSLSFDFDGETPATAEKYVTSTMTLFFNEFSSMFEERTTFSKFENAGQIVFEPTRFRYIDLVVNPMNIKKPQADGRYKMEHYDPSYYRIKVTVGWSVAENLDINVLAGSGYITANQLKNNIELINKTFMMCALDHEIKIGNEGTVELQINYRGYGDTILKSNRFNALIPVNEELELIGKQRELENLIQKNKCTNSQLIEMNASIAALRKKSSLRAFKRIMENLTINNLIYNFKLNTGNDDTLKAMSNFKEKGFFEWKPKFVILAGSSANEINAPVFPYFYFGDLFYYLLDCVYEKNSDVQVLGAENINFILTDFHFRDWLPNGPNVDDPQETIKNISIASLPISVEYFRNWFFSNISSQNIYNKPLIEFVLEFLNDVCGCMLTEVCFSREEDKSLMFRHGSNLVDNQNLFNLRGLAKQAEEGSIINCDNPQHFPLKITNNQVASLYTEMVYIYMDTQPKDTTVSSVDKIVTLSPGTNSGIVKNANWSKTNVSYLREGRMLKNQGIGDYAQLANYYNVSLSLYGNFLFFPGMMIYIDPSYLGGDTMTVGSETPGVDQDTPINFFRLMGIGGYHLITGVKSSIESGKFSTDIEARFLFSAEGDAINRLINLGTNGEENDIEDQNTVDPGSYNACNAVIQDTQAGDNTNE